MNARTARPEHQDSWLKGMITGYCQSYWWAWAHLSEPSVELYTEVAIEILAAESVLEGTQP